MTETIIQVERRVRPLRVGLVLEYTNRDAVRDAIRIASSHWGGTLWPLIPNFKRRPPWWPADLPGLERTANEIRAGFTTAFAPDFVVDTADRSRGGGFREIGLLDLVEPPDQYSRGTGAGLPVGAVFQHLWESGDRVLDRERARAVIPQPETPQTELLIGASFGTFSDAPALRPSQRTFRELFDAADEVIGPEAFLDGFWPTASTRFMGPLRVALAGVELRGERVADRLTFFVLDHRRASDIADFWNFRALGRHVIPLPLTWSERLLADLVDRLPESFREEELGVIGAQRVAEDEIRAAQERLRVAGVRAWRSFYPNFWSNRADPSSWRLDAVAAEDQVDVTVRDGVARVELLAPAAAPYYEPGRHRWISVVDPTTWSLPRDGTISGLLPSSLGRVDRLLKSFSSFDIRAGREGLLVPSGTTKDPLDWQPPSGRQVLAAHFDTLGHQSETSEPGYVADELIRRIGGLHGVRFVQDEPLVELLNGAAVADIDLADPDESGRRRLTAAYIKRQTLFETLREVNGADSQRAIRHLEFLVRRQVVASGPRLRCPHCTHWNWYRVSDLADELPCARCLRNFPFPHASPPPQSDWAYRTLGAFSFPSYAFGSYTVAFALRFLAEDAFEKTAWATNLSLGPQLEIDFAALREGRQRGGFEADEPVLLLGEAKSRGRFEERDFDRLRRLRAAFPSAVLVLATLRRILSPEEKAEVASLARPVPRTLRALHYEPRVIVLTGHELLGHESAPTAGKRLAAASPRLPAASESSTSRRSTPPPTSRCRCMPISKHTAIGCGAKSSDCGTRPPPTERASGARLQRQRRQPLPAPPVGLLGSEADGGFATYVVVPRHPRA